MVQSPVQPPAQPPAWLKAAPFLFLILWSSGFIFLKIGLDHADPLTFLALRYLCVLGLLAVPAWLYRSCFPGTLSSWLHTAMVGFLIQGCYFSFLYLGMKWGVSAGAAAVITCQQPLLIGLLAPAFTGERVGRRLWIGLILGVSGAVLVTLSKTSIEVASPLALVCTVLALVSISLGTLWEKRFGVSVHPLPASFIQCLVGLAVSAPLALSLEPMRLEWSGELLASLAYLVVCNSIVSISLLLAMVHHGEASRVSALFFLIPPMTALVAFLILGEVIPPLAWPGMALAVAGLYLVTHKGRT